MIFNSMGDEGWSLLELDYDTTHLRLNNVVRVYEDDSATRNSTTDTEEALVFHTLEVQNQVPIL